MTVIRADGSRHVEPAYDRFKLRAILHPSPPQTHVWAKQRAAILRRDGERCRYCNSGFGVLDVIQVVEGPDFRNRNVVTACADCKRRKGRDPLVPIPLSVHNPPRRSYAKQLVNPRTGLPLKN